MAEGKTNMFGKTYNTVGSTDSNFIIKTKGDLKVQWGNKYIDVIKNGKIASEGSKILFVVNSPDEIKQDGVYIVTSTEGNELWVCIDGIKIQIANTSEETTYVSFLVEQKATADQKHLALTNIGFYYEDLQSAKSAGILSGIIYVEKDNKLYIAKNGVLTEYIITQTTNNGVTEETTETRKHPLYILDYSLWESGVEYIRCSGDVIQTLKTITAHLLIQSPEASSEKGFRLYIDDLDSILEIDRILWRKYPNPITYSELESMMDNKKLNPKMYYLISDFQNPWEVSWSDEPLYFEDQYIEINEKEYLIGYRNGLKLIVKAKNEELIEEQVWSPLHPDWIIHYDPYFKGEEHIVIENEEEVKYYGFRTRTDEDGIVSYLPCKGQITYLKDEFGNEGNFNFRHHRYKKDIYDDVTNTYATVWRYCMDKHRINDSEVIYGEFFEKGINNKFFFKNNLTYNLLISITLEYDENGTITKYEFEDIEPEVLISEGQNLTIYSSEEIIENNTFEATKEYPVKDSTINKVNSLVGNTFKDIFNLTVSGGNVLNNSITNILEVITEMDWKNNTVLSTTGTNPMKFKVPRAMTFEDNYLEDCTGMEDIDHMGNFKKNTIIKSHCIIENNQTDSISVGSIGDFNENVIKDSTITVNMSDFYEKVFEKNIILNKCELTIINYGKFIQNTLDQTKGKITNELGTIEENNVKVTDIVINNVSNILKNKITANGTSIINNYEASEISENNITDVDNINNYLLITQNNLNTIKDINNSGTIKGNKLVECNYINNQGDLLNNNINNTQQIYNIGVADTNTIELAVNINNENNIINNIIDIAETINNYGDMQNNIILEITSLTNYGNLKDNTINTIVQMNNDGTISNNSIDHIENLNNSGTISDNNIKTIVDYLDNSSNVSNNNIGLIESLTINADILYNTIEEIKSTTINGTFSENIFDIITNSTFNGVCLLNNSKKNFNNSLVNDFINNIIYLNINSLIPNGSITNCIFKYDILNFYPNNLINCLLEFINNLSLDRDAVHTAFHGSIGNPDRQLTEHEWDLLGDGGKKTDAYPNMRVVCVPEIIKKGMILMWYGKEEIPKGWALCDGKNGTPDLVGSFIKGDSSTADKPTVPEGVDEETNEYTLKTEHLPKHSHPHKAHQHYFEGSGSTTITDDYASYNSSYSVNEGEGGSTTSGENWSAPSESETITIDISGNTSSVTSEEDGWQYNDPPTPIKLEPKHFKIIFIMKIDENPE